MNYIMGLPGKVKPVCKKYVGIFFLIIFFVFYSVMLFYESYYLELYISPDSVSYLKEAEAIRDGYGFNLNGPAGGDLWFATWPVGYPALIAFFMLLLPGHSAYFASRIVTLAVVGIILAVFYKRYGNYAWIFALLFFNPGVLTVFFYAWSEVPFVLFLVLYCYSMVVVIKEDKPGWRNYGMLLISMLGAFLVRYFGIITYIYLIFYWVAVFWRFLFKYRGKNKCLRDKLICIFFIEAVSVLYTIFYLYRNYKMSGFMTGTDRSFFRDNIPELFRNLQQALITEISYLFQQANHPLFKYWNSGGRTWLYMIIILLAFMGIVYLLYRRKSKDEVFVLLSFGIFYYAAFIAIRFYSSMDGFGFRFFAPASFLIGIGFTNLLTEYLSEKKIEPIKMIYGIVLFMIFSITSIVTALPSSKESAYGILYSSVLKELYQVPPHTMLLNSSSNVELDWRWPAVRTDLAAAAIAEKESVEHLLQRAKGYDYICISKKVLEEEMVPNEVYSGTARDWLIQHMTEGGKSEKYLVIPIKELINTKIYN